MLSGNAFHIDGVASTTNLRNSSILGRGVYFTKWRPL